MRKLIAVVAVIVLGLGIGPSTPAVAGTDDCKAGPARSAYHCFGAKSGSDAPDSSSPDIRRPTAKGKVDTEILAFTDIVNSGGQPTPELYRQVCLGNKPSALTKNLCWVATPLDLPQGPSPSRQATELAQEYFHKLPLPVPTPQMSSPKGVCGIEHSIDLHMVPEKVYVTDTPNGPLRLHAYATVYIDWGDGRTTVTHSGGAPYPKSDIDHYWENRGTYDISVLVSWSADWSVGNIASGTVGGAYTQGVIEDWLVQEIQAVIIS